MVRLPWGNLSRHKSLSLVPSLHRTACNSIITPNTLSFGQTSSLIARICSLQAAALQVSIRIPPSPIPRLLQPCATLGLPNTQRKKQFRGLTISRLNNHGGLVQADVRLVAEVILVSLVAVSLWNRILRWSNKSNSLSCSSLRGLKCSDTDPESR